LRSAGFLEHFKQCYGRKGDEPQSHKEHKGSKESIFVFFVTLWLSGYSADLLTTTDAYLERLAERPDDAPATKAAKTALVAKFVAHQLSASFVQDLIDDRAAIDAASDELVSGRVEGVENTAAVGRLIRAGMKEVIYLNAIMHNKYARNPDKLRAWESASRIERAPQREKSAANVTTVNVPQPNPLAA